MGGAWWIGRETGAGVRLGVLVACADATVSAEGRQSKLLGP